MNICSLALVGLGLFTTAGAAAASHSHSPGAFVNVESKSSSLTASAVLRARRSVQLALTIKRASSAHTSNRRNRRRELEDPFDLEDALASLGITDIPRDEDGNIDFDKLDALLLGGGEGSGFSLEDLMGDGGIGGDGDDMDKELEDLMGDLMGDMDMDIDMDMDGLDNLFGGLFGDGAEDGNPASSGIGSFVCGIFDMMDEDMATTAGMTCDCDAPDSGDLVLECRTTEEICDVPPDAEGTGTTLPMDGVAQEGVEFCVSSATSTIVIPLGDFMDSILNEGGGEVADEDIPEASVESCAVYSAPAYIADKTFCFKATIDLDMDEMMPSMVGDGTSDPAAAMENLSELIECEAFINEVECKSCRICDNGLGIELDCPGLFSESCTDLMGAVGTEGGDAALPTDGLPTSTSIVRFAQATDDSSPASSNKIGAAVVGTLLSITLFVASP